MNTSYSDFLMDPASAVDKIRRYGAKSRGLLVRSRTETTCVTLKSSLNHFGKSDMDYYIGSFAGCPSYVAMSHLEKESNKIHLWLR